MRKLKQILKSKKGETYIGVVIFLLVALFMIAFMIQMGGVVLTKLALDDEAKQIVKTVQIEGGITEKSQAMIDDVRNKYSVDKNGDGDTDDAGESVADIKIIGENMVLKEGTTDQYLIQLGDAFEVDISCGYRVGFGKLSVSVPLTSKQVGVSEYYWKELSE